MKRAVLVLLFVLTGCASFSAQVAPAKEASPALQATKQNTKVTPLDKLIAAAVEQVGVTTEYDPAYVKLTYPNGDVPLKTGVCADVIVRAFRKVNLDLQKELHEDMKRSFAKYPKKWGAKAPDTNIDHRRVPNLMTWFDRQGKALPLSQEAKDYLPGDVVAWELGGGLTHIGLVSDLKADGTTRHLIVHNIGAGTQIEDRLFDWKVIGRYRYFNSPEKSVAPNSISSFAKPKISTLKESELAAKAGCHFSLLPDFKQDIARYVWFSAKECTAQNGRSICEDSALLNVNGVDTKLLLTAESTLPLTTKPRYRFWKVYTNGALQAKIAYRLTKQIPNEQDPKASEYAVTITVTNNYNTQIIAAQGWCDC